MIKLAIFLVCRASRPLDGASRSVLYSTNLSNNKIEKKKIKKKRKEEEIATRKEFKSTPACPLA